MPSPQHTPNPTSALFFEAPLPPRPDSEPTLTDLSASVPLPTLLSLRSPTSNSYINTNKKNMTVHFNEIHVLETLASGQVTSIFKAVWRKERGGGTKGNKLVACKCAGLKNGKGEEKDLKDLREVSCRAHAFIIIRALSPTLDPILTRRFAPRPTPGGYHRRPFEA